MKSPGIYLRERRSSNLCLQPLSFIWPSPMQLPTGFSQDTQLIQHVAARSFVWKPEPWIIASCRTATPTRNTIYFTSSPSPLSHHTEGAAELGAYTKKPQQVTKHDSTLWSSCEVQCCEEWWCWWEPGGTKVHPWFVVCSSVTIKWNPHTSKDWPHCALCWTKSGMRFKIM